MPSKPDKLNIPAYQRKRSLAAKARKSTTRKTRTTRRRTVRAIPETDIPARAQLPSELLFPPEQMERSHRSNLREMRACGSISGYFDRIDVAVLKLTSPIRQGDRILIEKNNGLFEQDINSMQIDRKEVKIARSGQEIGMKVLQTPKIGGTIYKII